MCPENQAGKRKQVSLKNAADMEIWLEETRNELRAVGWTYEDLFAIRLALEEAIVNAMKHGNRGDINKHVLICYSFDGDFFLARITDQGSGFDPKAVPDPLVEENLERDGGRGLLLIRSYMNWVRHNKMGNSITLCKKRGPGD